MRLPIFKRKSRDKPKNTFIGSAYSFFFGGTSSGKSTIVNGINNAIDFIRNIPSKMYS